MRKFNVYTDKGDYIVEARSKAHAVAIVWEMTRGRATSIIAEVAA